MSDTADEALTDPELLALTAAGNRVAFDEIVRRHHASVFRLARAVVHDSSDAEDVLQQAFLAAWRHAGQFRGESTVRTWLLTITRHAALGVRVRHRREPRDDTPLDELGVRAGWGGPDPERLALAAEDLSRLTSALAALPPEYREVLTLRDLEGLSGEDTATLLGLGLAAMKSRLHRARLSLAAHLTEVSRATR